MVPDALTALQQGTIDGEENPINVIYSYKLWESQKYVTLDRHSYSTAIITMSNDLFKSLPEDVQKIFEESAQELLSTSVQWGWLIRKLTSSRRSRIMVWKSSRTRM